MNACRWATICREENGALTFALIIKEASWWERSVKHVSAEEFTSGGAEVVKVSPPVMSRHERLLRWADILERHDGQLHALRQVEYLPVYERRACRGDNSPLAVAFNDPVLRAEGLRGDRLGEAMDFFELSDREAHRLLCDCHYLGSMTGPRLARNLRRHVARQAFFTRVSQAIGRFFGRSA